MTISGEIPRINVKDKASYQNLLQTYGAADFRSVVLRNIEKDYIEKEAAHLSVVESVLNIKAANNLHVILNASVNGGVVTTSAVDPGVGNIGFNQAVKPLVTKSFALTKYNTTYVVSHEAKALGESDIATNDSIAEAREQLGVKMDSEFLTKIIAKKFGDNDVTAANTWGSTGKPYDDINKATNNIIKNSAIRPNAVNGPAWFSAICPITLRESMQRIQMIDGVKTSMTQELATRLNTQVLYTRAPFNYDGTWPLTNKVVVLPTKDRRIGSFYIYDGSEMPSIFTTVDEHGTRVSTNTWMGPALAANEETGEFTDNKRVAVISSVA